MKNEMKKKRKNNKTFGKKGKIFAEKVRKKTQDVFFFFMG